MGARSKIEWTESTWNPIRGCSRVSEGCRNCYAERVAARFSGPGQPYEGLAVVHHGEPRWTGEVRLIERHLADPLRWTSPRRIFVNSMSDLFHEKLPSEEIDLVFAAMLLAQRHTFQVLTKRPERMLEYLNCPGRRSEVMECAAVAAFDEASLRGRSGRLPEAAVQAWDDEHAPCGMRIKDVPWPLPNVWLGVSVEDQKTADERISLLLQTPAAIRWVSYEPALGPVDFRRIFIGEGETGLGYLRKYRDSLSQWESGERKNGTCKYSANKGPGLDWIVAGGESGPGARPADPDWFRGARDECLDAKVPFFFKQWGEYAPSRVGHFVNGPVPEWRPPDSRGMVRMGKKAAGRLLDGREWNEYPETK